MNQNLSAMEQIWDQMKKSPEQTVTFSQADVDYLYFNGFVDTDSHNIEAWRAAFKPFLDKDKNILLTKDHFLSLAPMRYNGPVPELFDPMTLREGEWADADLQKLFDEHIGPASLITADIFWKFVNTLKEKGEVMQNGAFDLRYGTKLGFREFLETYPSPKRLLAKNVFKARIKNVTGT